MALCTFDGNSDMYGLGIRLGFYLQWLSEILATILETMAKATPTKDALVEELSSLIFANSVFVAATFLALIIQIAENVNNLEFVEVYIILLLTFGSNLAVIPVYIWRLVTRWNPLLDPTRFMPDPGAVWSLLFVSLLLPLCVFQTWFWIARIPRLNEKECQEYGFLFTRIPLNNSGFRILNIMLYLLLLLICFGNLFRSCLIYSKHFEERSAGIDMDEAQSWQLRNFRNLYILFRLSTACIVITATELTIHWNAIDNVNSVSSAGQTIPLLVGIGAMVRILYVWLRPEKRGDGRAGDNQEGDNQESNGRHSPGPVSGERFVRMATPFYSDYRSSRLEEQSDPIAQDRFVRTAPRSPISGRRDRRYPEKRHDRQRYPHPRNRDPNAPR